MKNKKLKKKKNDRVLFCYGKMAKYFFFQIYFFYFSFFIFYFLFSLFIFSFHFLFFNFYFFSKVQVQVCIDGDI